MHISTLPVLLRCFNFPQIFARKKRDMSHLQCSRVEDIIHAITLPRYASNGRSTTKLAQIRNVLVQLQVSKLRSKKQRNDQVYLSIWVRFLSVYKAF